VSVQAAPWPLALAGALVVTEAAVLLLRPRTGLIAPDPVAVEEHFSPQEVARARAFSRPQLALQLSVAIVRAALLGGAVARPPALLGGGRPLRRGRLRRKRASSMLRAAAGGAALSAALELATLPLSALARRRALAVGLATQSWPGWALDVAKSTAVGSALSAGAAPAALTLMRRLPRWWWLPGAGVAVAGGTLFTFLAPVALDPLFNRFSPLAEGPTRSDVLELAERAGVRVGEAYEVDASRRTTAANAYVTGLGATKRVVLFDSLLKRASREETRLVVAHELAHVHHRDVPYGLLQLALVAPAALHATAALARSLGGVDDPGRPTAASLPALALALGAVGAATGAVSAQLSRRIEARADAFSLRLTDAPEPFISLERRIVLQNLSDPDPPRWLSGLLGSHPTTVQRIGIARAYARGVR
jgi:STE24 endopeptidase